MPNRNYKPSFNISKRDLTITPKNPGPIPYQQQPDFNGKYMGQGRIVMNEPPGLLDNLGDMRNPYRTT